MDKGQLEGLSRDQLIALADGLGISRPSTLTQPELVDEIILARAAARGEPPPPRGFFGRARDLLKSVIGRGLHLPEAAAKALRPSSPPPSGRTPKPPVATMTLAEIYAAQGHAARAITVLDDVLAQKPDHAEARALRDRLSAELDHPSPRSARSESSRAPSKKADPIPDATLPDRYDVDEVVAIAVDPQTLYLYWEIRPTTFAEARAAHADGSLVLRIVSVSSGTLLGATPVAGPFAQQRDVPVDGLLGEMFVRSLTPGSNIRVSIGWRYGEGFDPLAVGLELTTPRTAAGDLAGGVAPAPVDPHATHGVSRRLEEMLGKEGKRIVTMTLPGVLTKVRALGPTGHALAEEVRTVRGEDGAPATEVLWIVQAPGSSDLTRRRRLYPGASDLSRAGS